MISVYIKQTSSVESQRVAQLVGNVHDAEFQQRAKKLYNFFFPDDSNPAQTDSMPQDICTRRFEVTVLSASNLPQKDLLGSVDPFCQVAYADIVHQSKKKMRDYNPSWKDESFLFDVPTNQLLSESNQGSSIKVDVLDWDRLTTNDLIGSVSIPNDAVNEVLKGPEGFVNEFEIALKKNENPVSNAAGSPTILKIRLKNVGLVISGCEVEALKRFFLLYDENNDGMIDEEEFSAMLKKILSVTMLFTGTESGDYVLKTLSPVQIRALLDHEWLITEDPDDSLTGKLQFIMNNIKKEDQSGKNQPQAESQHMEDNRSENTDNQASEQVQDMNEMNFLSESRQGKDSIEIIEEAGEELEKLARKLRRYGVITLPPLLWGSCNEDMQDSLEGIALRYLFLNCLEFKYNFKHSIEC
jgi:hypothetical protein